MKHEELTASQFKYLKDRRIRQDKLINSLLRVLGLHAYWTEAAAEYEICRVAQGWM